MNDECKLYAVDFVIQILLHYRLKITIQYFSDYFYMSIKNAAMHQKLTPVILVMQEVKIKRIMVRSQPRQIVPETLSQKLITKEGLVEWFKVKPQ
jgi:hypothetical protein